jgi:aspartate/methionine/tyrosine aminotransferase
MHWAKTSSRARYNLATSGAGAFPLREMPFDCSRLEINGENTYGFAPLKQAIGRKYGVAPECIVTSDGTSMANHLAMAAILEPGDEALLEHPIYGPVLDAAEYLGASIRRFPRRPENAWAIDPGEVRRAITPKTTLVVVTNLHNPTSVLTPQPVLREIAEIAASVGATLLVDEVYLDAVYENTPPTSFHLAPNIVVTSSLTKVYGVSGLRCGWIFAQPDLARRMLHLNNLFGASPSHPSEILSVAAFENLETLRARARRVVEADRASLAQFLAQQPAFEAAPTDFGTTSFLRLKRGNADDFLERLRGEYETSAVPGRFFEAPDHFRIGMGVNHEMFVEGLRRIGLALA